MLLEGSCHCIAVRFSLHSHTPYPYAHCYCSICRKTAGSGGSGIFLLGLAETLKIEGDENITRYQTPNKVSATVAARNCGFSTPAGRNTCIPSPRRSTRRCHNRRLFWIISSPPGPRGRFRTRATPSSGSTAPIASAWKTGTGSGGCGWNKSRSRRP